MEKKNRSLKQFTSYIEYLKQVGVQQDKNISLKQSTVFVCVFMHTYEVVCVHVEARGQRQVFPLTVFHVIFL